MEEIKIKEYIDSIKNNLKLLNIEMKYEKNILTIEKDQFVITKDSVKDIKVLFIWITKTLNKYLPEEFKSKNVDDINWDDLIKKLQ